MGFFNWAAPMFRQADKRWTDEDVRAVANRLEPWLGGGGGLLDVGGGTGALSVRLSRIVSSRVTVLDSTPEMVRYIPGDARVDVVLGRAESMPFAADTFDVILVSDAFHHFRDQSAALREFARVLRPGGGVLVLELDPSHRGMRFVAFVEWLLGEPAAFLAPAQLCALMAEAGIDGSCASESGPSYRFVGQIAASRDAGSPHAGG